MASRVARHAHRTGTGPGSVLLLLGIAAVAGELMDGLTRFALPDIFELNRLSQLLGGGWSLGAKAVLLGLVLYVAWANAVSGRRVAAGAVLLTAALFGFFGAATNLGVLL